MISCTDAQPHRVYNVSSVRIKAFIPFKCTMWHSCKAPLVFNGTPKLPPLVSSVFFAAGRIYYPRVSEKQKKHVFYLPLPSLGTRWSKCCVYEFVETYNRMERGERLNKVEIMSSECRNREKILENVRGTVCGIYEREPVSMSAKAPAKDVTMSRGMRFSGFIRTTQENGVHYFPFCVIMP